MNNVRLNSEHKYGERKFPLGFVAPDLHASSKPLPNQIPIKRNDDRDERLSPRWMREGWAII
jgi:hypothetical protein